MGSKNKNKKKSGTSNGNNGNGANGSEHEPVVGNDTVKDVENPEAVEDTQVVEDTAELAKEEEEEEEITEEKPDPKDERIEDLQKQIEQLKKSSAAKPVVANNDEINELKAKLDEKTKENELNETNYKNLLSKLSGMKSLFAKMKQSEVDLENSEEEKRKLSEKLLQTDDEKNVLIGTIKDLKEEIKNLNSECNSLSQRSTTLNNDYQTTERELDRLQSQNRELQSQVKELKTNQEEYLIMMNEEKLLRQNLSNEIFDLKQMLEYKDSEINTHTNDKTALNEKLAKLEEQVVIKTSEFEIKSAQFNNEYKNLENQLAEKEKVIAGLEKDIAEAKEEITKLGKLEKENKDKQLQIGKLRHEAIILNDHLTKALKLIKKDSNSESVDRELVSNLFISFLNLPRGDSKKFQALELIANYLNWDKDMRVHAGIENKTKGDELNRSRQSFVSLWTEYLEKESTKEGGKVDN